MGKDLYMKATMEWINSCIKGKFELKLEKKFKIQFKLTFLEQVDFWLRNKGNWIFLGTEMRWYNWVRISRKEYVNLYNSQYLHCRIRKR